MLVHQHFPLFYDYKIHRFSLNKKMSGLLCCNRVQLFIRQNKSVKMESDTTNVYIEVSIHRF